MRIFILDDDRGVVTTLKLIIHQQDLGTVCGSAANGQEALEELQDAAADIVLVDLLMPVMDGITFIKKARAAYPQMAFIMLSFVSNEEMIARAYEAGVEFYIHKPLNSIEVCNVIRKVQRLRQLESAFTKMQQIMGTSTSGQAEARRSENEQTYVNSAEEILTRLGIAGESVSREILQMIGFINEQKQQPEPTVAQLCAHFSDSPKALEQRIRRAIVTGMENLANRGIEDYGDDTFHELAGTLYNFKEVRQEMEFIRKKSNKHGKVSVKKFLYTLAAICSITK